VKNNTPYLLFGILGHPLSHTLSPCMHKAAFRSKNTPAFYLALDFTPESLVEFQKNLKASPFRGFNITVPYKERMLSAADVLSKQAKQVGAINTLMRRGGRWYGENTDVDGLLMSLQNDAGFSPRNKKVLILGSGGAARGAVFAMAKSGAQEICLCNRTLSKAVKIIRDFKKYFPQTSFIAIPLEAKKIQEQIHHADLIIHATSLGLKATDPALLKSSWIPPAKTNSRKLFFDLIYKPPTTLFLKAAKKKGHKTLNGLGMLLYQGVLAWEMWMGQKAPIHVMKKALWEGVKSRS